MRDYYETPSQFELFPGSVRKSAPQIRQGMFLKDLVIPVENLLILGIVVLMGLVTTFCLGVDRGRKIIVKDVRKLPVSANRSAAPKSSSAPRPVSTGLGMQAKPAAQALRSGVIQAAVPASVPRLLLAGTTAAGKATGKSGGEKVYTVQVASFKQESYAREEASDIKGHGHETFILPKGSYSIVCVGKFVKKDEATMLSQRLKKVYKDCLVRSL